MGYSIGVRTKGKRYQQEMVSLLDEHYRSWPEITKSRDQLRLSKPTNEANYDKSKLFIGFNYSFVTGWERFYAYSLCRWMAITIGRRQTSFKEEGVAPLVLKTPTPYIIYDGHDKWPVIVTTEKVNLPKAQKHFATDKYGVVCYENKWRDYLSSAMEECYFGNDAKKLKKIMTALEKEKSKADLNGLWDRKKITQSQWVNGIYAIELKHMRPLMEEAFKSVRDEMKRLDDIWKKRHPEKS